MPRTRLRVPGRYERPAELRGPLGDKLTEAGIRDGYAAAARARQQVREARGSYAAGGPVAETTSAGGNPVAGAGECSSGLTSRRTATVELVDDGQGHTHAMIPA